MTDVWYDTREGLQARLESGLPGLREIAKARHEAHYDRGETMKSWCLLGIFFADSLGNLSLITEGAPADAFRDYREPPVPVVMLREEMGRYTQRWVATHGSCIPPGDDRCDRCGRGWTVNNVRDFIDREPKSPRHLACHRLAIIEGERRDMVEIVKRSEIPYTDLYMIPNEYVPNSDHYGPWVMVVTAVGRIKIGWRLRVIQIDWSETALAATGDVVVEKPNVTHGPKYVHAWSKDKAVEALRKLWNGGTS